jgi:N-methylhydantoinase B/oxoprolinase/acetone carboxylase alpha subunit
MQTSTITNVQVETSSPSVIYEVDYTNTIFDEEGNLITTTSGDFLIYTSKTNIQVDNNNVTDVVDYFVSTFNLTKTSSNSFDWTT